MSKCCDAQGAQYVWYDTEGFGRNLFASFRLAFELEGVPESAELSLFADTAYQLFVNGLFVEFGPVRFDPRFPLFDTVDLMPHLRAGRNVISVLVNSFQHKTYKAIEHPAGFIAWGGAKTSTGEVVTFATPGGWKVIPDPAHARYSAKFSFALNAAELFDQSAEETGWKEPSFDDRHWLEAVLVKQQDAWGELKPRSIPFMSKTPVSVAAVRHLLPLDHQEDRYSFSVPFPQCFASNREQFNRTVLFTTWIYAPETCNIHAGVFWGEYWLNGQKIPRGVDCVARNQRSTQTWNLRKGWNHFFGMVEAYHDVVEQYIALPKGLGLRVCADKQQESCLRFRHTPILSARVYDGTIAQKTLPLSEDDELPEIGGWLVVHATQMAQCPSREMGWDRYADPLESLIAENLGGHCFRLTDYPQGFSLLLDLGQTYNILPKLSLEGGAGATVDLAYTEHLCSDQMHVKFQHHHPCADRLLCSRHTIDWLPVHPRGGRYLMLTVRNPQSDITLKSLQLLSAMYPVEERGRFSCSDPLLTAIWQMGKHTQAVNMEDAYVDCVCRERGMYGRDTIIQYHVNLATFGDQALMGRCMQLYGQSPDPSGKFRAVYPSDGNYTIADFALNMVEGYWNYYENSGDLERIRLDWSAIRRDLQWFHGLSDERPDLLLDSDWPKKRGLAAMYGGFHGDLSSKGMLAAGPNCSFSCTYLMAIRAALRLATVLDDHHESSSLTARAEVLVQSIRSAFWDEVKGGYADNLEHTTFSAHASLLAVSSGAAEAAQLKDIRNYVAQELTSLFRNGAGLTVDPVVSPSYAFYLFAALYQLGLTETAEAMMRQGWGWMLDQGLQTCSEYFTLESSHCHAWSASPTYYLSKNVLGVHFPLAPNFDLVEIRVQTHGVTWAEGAFPHPRGLIEVKWHTEDGFRVFDLLRAPTGVKIKVREGSPARCY